jgi:hypothetical protein
MCSEANAVCRQDGGAEAREDRKFSESTLDLNRTFKDSLQKPQRRAFSQHSQRQWPAVAQVFEEVLLNHPCQLRVENGEIDFVVESEGAVIEVGGADHTPLPIDCHQFGVDHGGEIFEYFGACLQQVAAAVAAQGTDHGVIDARTGGEDLYLHSASLHGFCKCPARASIREKVRCGDADGLRGAFDESLEEDACLGPAALGRA